MTDSLYSYVVLVHGVSPSEFTTIIDRYPDEVPNWYSPFPGAILVVSGMSATNLTTFIRSKVPSIKYILVLDTNTDRNGWMPKKAWEFIKNPRKA
jgi:hypothetical protein